MTPHDIAFPSTILIEPLPAVKPPRDLIGLALGPSGRGVSREIASRGD